VNKNQFEPFNYQQNAENALDQMGLNSGNNVFQFSLQKMMLSPYQQVEPITLRYFFSHIDEINERFDAVVYSPANMLAPWMKNTGLLHWTRAFKKMKIPAYFVGVGSQADNYYNLDFVNDFKQEGYDFISSLLETGGALGVRGYFTAEVVKQLGFSDADINTIGCPSLLMNGPNLKIKKKKITRNEFNPILNGNKFWFDGKFHKIFGLYPNSIFICQDLLYRLLYDKSSITEKDAEYIRGNLFSYLFKKHRVRLYCDYLAWHNEIITGGFNFSIGTRIHGNIVSLLAGIPCYIDSFDSRVREMAEYFDIPNGHVNSDEDIYDIYSEVSYLKFNATFSDKFYQFKKFMNANGLPFYEDPEYIEQYISKLNFEAPKYLVDSEFIEQFTTKYLNKYYPNTKQ
jgi:hypothetical protein